MAKTFTVVARVTVKESGSKRFLKTLQKKPRNLKVGILAPDADIQYTGDQGPTTIGEAAFYNEFGTQTIPARSWLRSWVDGNRKRLQAEQLKAYQQIALPPFKNEKATLEAMGQKYSGEIRKNIAGRIPPPNAQFTVEKKGFDFPLVDSGQLMQAVSHRVDE